MTLVDIHPFLRFSGHASASYLGQYIKPLRACDHRCLACENGSGIIRIDGEEYSMQAGAVVLIQAGVPYQYTSLSEDFSLFTFNFDMTQRHADKKTPIPPWLAESIGSGTALEDAQEYPQELPRVLYTVDAEALTLAARLEREYRHAALFHEIRSSHLLADLIVLCVRSAMRRGVPKAAQLVSGVTSYIREHYSEPCDNATIAQIFSYHPNYINRLITEHTGMSLHRYVNRTRIGHAQVLLESGKYTVSEVSVMVGFADIAHFSKTFRKFVGLSPLKYSARGNAASEKDAAQDKA